MKGFFVFFAVLLSLSVLGAPAAAIQIYSMERAAESLDTFYAEFFALTGTPYHSPGVVIVEDVDEVVSPCGVAQDGIFGLYCYSDHTIYIERDMDPEVVGDDRAMSYFILAHEWAHHIQRISDMDTNTTPDAFNHVYSIEIELMADCMAGAWYARLDDEGKLDLGDLTTAVVVSSTVGDTYGLRSGSNAHGTGTERAAAVLAGYERGLVGCMNVPLAEAIG